VNCDETLNLLDPFVDGELPEQERGTVQQHLDGCPSCQHELRQINELRETLARTPRYVAPDSLESDVHEMLAMAADQPATRPSWGRWMKPMTTHAAAAMLGALFFYGALQPSSAPTMPMREIVAAHVRSLMDDRLTQVRSNDTHNVGPWFAGKIDFAPAVYDLNAKGFPLLGGRVDYLHDKKVAALVYLRRKHRINVFISPETGTQTKKWLQTSHNGYNIVGWHDRGFQYWAISDLNPKELTEFSKLAVAQ